MLPVGVVRGGISVCVVYMSVSEDEYVYEHMHNYVHVCNNVTVFYNGHIM